MIVHFQLIRTDVGVGQIPSIVWKSLQFWLERSYQIFCKFLQFQKLGILTKKWWTFSIHPGKSHGYPPALAPSSPSSPTLDLGVQTVRDLGIWRWVLGHGAFSSEFMVGYRFTSTEEMGITTKQQERGMQRMCTVYTPLPDPCLHIFHWQHSTLTCGNHT